MKVMVMKNVLHANRKLADGNREYFRSRNITAVNVMASPGAGKTSVILELIGILGNDAAVYVIEGDIASDMDAERISSLGVRVVQINTAGGCHLDANMIAAAVRELNPAENSLLFIENIGNLVCPSAFDLGENIRMLVASVPEGHDKPYKYVSMFEAVDAVVLNKTDLMPYVDFDRDFFYRGIRALNRETPVFETSCRTGEGLDRLAEWLKNNKQVK